MNRSLMAAAVLVALGTACPATAVADDASSELNAGLASSTDTDKADENFNLGRALLKDKRYAEACLKFEESQRQDPASGTLLALAYCQELSGSLATSSATYAAAAQLAEREGHGDRLSAATERARALASRVSKLTVVIPPELLSMPGFQLLRDGAEFNRAAVGVALPTDGGGHAFAASAPGRVRWSSTVTLRNEGDQQTLVVPVLDPVLADRHSVKVQAPLVPDVGREGGSLVTLRSVSLGLAVGSVVGLGLGTAFAFSAKSKNDDSMGYCSGGCGETGTALRNSALTAARASTWSFIASGALAAGSVTLYLVAGRNSLGSKRATKVQATISMGAPTVAVVGNF